MALATCPDAMRPFLRALFVFSASLCGGCGLSTFEMSGSERGGLIAPSVAKVDAGPAPVVAVDAGAPVGCESSVERCDNGLDDDCDERIDHADTDCTPVVHTCEDAEGGGCNGDPGFGDRCAAVDNEEACSPARFNAWCNRRNPEFPNIWDRWVHDWVSTRCDGTTEETGTQYSTWFCRSSSNDEFRCTTPLVLSFDSAPVRFEATTRSFSFKPGNPVVSDWPAAVTPWLARDVDGNGKIDDGSELFGSNTGTARHGFEALAPLDGNADGVLDARDPLFGSVLVWRDVNGDRISQAGELTTLRQERVVSLSLSFSVQSRCDLRGNCEGERSGFTWRSDDGSVRQGSIVDVYLRTSTSVALTPLPSPLPLQGSGR